MYLFNISLRFWVVAHFSRKVFIQTLYLFSDPSSSKQVFNHQNLPKDSYDTVPLTTTLYSQLPPFHFSVLLYFSSLFSSSLLQNELFCRTSLNISIKKKIWKKTKKKKKRILNAFEDIFENFFGFVLNISGAKI